MNAFVGISRCCISLVDWMFDSMNLFRIGFAFEILIEFVSLWSFLSSVTSKLFRCSDEYLVSKRYFLYERFCRFTVACHKCNFRIEKELRALHLHQTQTKHSKYWHRHQQATVAPSYAQFECKYSRHGLVSTSIRRLEREADGSSSQRRHNIFALRHLALHSICIGILRLEWIHQILESVERDAIFIFSFCLWKHRYSVFFHFSTFFVLQWRAHSYFCRFVFLFFNSSRSCSFCLVALRALLKPKHMRALCRSTDVT